MALCHDGYNRDATLGTALSSLTAHIDAWYPGRMPFSQRNQPTSLLDASSGLQPGFAFVTRGRNPTDPERRVIDVTLSHFLARKLHILALIRRIGCDYVNPATDGSAQ